MIPSLTNGVKALLVLSMTALLLLILALNFRPADSRLQEADDSYRRGKLPGPSMGERRPLIRRWSFILPWSMTISRILAMVIWHIISATPTSSWVNIQGRSSITNALRL